jgi:hypothetical protein
MEHGDRTTHSGLYLRKFRWIKCLSNHDLLMDGYFSVVSVKYLPSFIHYYLFRTTTQRKSPLFNLWRPPPPKSLPHGSKHYTSHTPITQHQPISMREQISANSTPLRIVSAETIRDNISINREIISSQIGVPSIKLKLKRLSAPPSFGPAKTQSRSKVNCG